MKTDTIGMIREMVGQRAKVTAAESALVDALKDLMPQLGYTLTPVVERAIRRGGKRQVSRGKHRVSPDSHPCPKCPRKFGMAAHLGRHLKWHGRAVKPSKK